MVTRLAHNQKTSNACGGSIPSPATNVKHKAI